MSMLSLVEQALPLLKWIRRAEINFRFLIAEMIANIKKNRPLLQSPQFLQVFK
jgi:hypothetical protein